LAIVADWIRLVGSGTCGSVVLSTSATHLRGSRNGVLKQEDFW